VAEAKESRLCTGSVHTNTKSPRKNIEIDNDRKKAERNKRE
jgi:hypothetical protein